MLKRLFKPAAGLLVALIVVAIAYFSTLPSNCISQGGSSIQGDIKTQISGIWYASETRANKQDKALLVGIYETVQFISSDTVAVDDDIWLSYSWTRDNRLAIKGSYGSHTYKIGKCGDTLVLTDDLGNAVVMTKSPHPFNSLFAPKLPQNQ